MMNMLCEQKAVIAKLVRVNASPCLVVSFSKSEPSVVWQFDLEKNPNFTIVLRDVDRGCNLGVTSPDGIFTPVAHFVTREEAEMAYKAVHKVLMRQSCCGASGIWGRLALILIGLVLFFVLVVTVAQRIGSGGKSGTVTTVAPITGETNKPLAPAEIKPGIPLPADEVLKPPRD